MKNLFSKVKTLSILLLLIVLFLAWDLSESERAAWEEFGDKVKKDAVAFQETVLQEMPLPAAGGIWSDEVRPRSGDRLFHNVESTRLAPNERDHEAFSHIARETIESIFVDVESQIDDSEGEALQSFGDDSFLDPNRAMLEIFSGTFPGGTIGSSSPWHPAGIDNR